MAEPSELFVLCIHESSHAVVAHALHEPLGSVSVHAEGGAFTASARGRLRATKGHDSATLFALITSALTASPERKAGWKPWIIVALASLPAQRKVDAVGQYDDWCSDDAMRAHTVAHKICETPNEAEALLAEARTTAAELVEANWSAILSVSELLLLRRQLDRSEILEAIEMAHLSPAERARRRWEAEVLEGSARFELMFGDLRPL
jgi:hypothetical protein